MLTCIAAMVREVSAQVEENLSVRVSWNNNGFPSISDFVVYYRQNDSEEAMERMVNVSARNNFAVIKNLIQNNHYIFEVAARGFENGTAIVGPKGTSNVVTVINIVGIHNSNDGQTGNLIVP